MTLGAAALRLSERANVLSKRAGDERTGHPIGDGVWPPDRGSVAIGKPANSGQLGPPRGGGWL